MHRFAYHSTKSCAHFENRDQTSWWNGQGWSQNGREKLIEEIQAEWEQIAINEVMAASYRNNHEDAQIYKYTTGICHPMRNYFSLFHRQVIANPRKVGKQFDNLNTRGQLRGEELAQTQREVQSSDEERHQAGVDETTGNMRQKSIFMKIENEIDYLTFSVRMNWFFCSFA